MELNWRAGFRPWGFGLTGTKRTKNLRKARKTHAVQIAWAL